MVLFSTGCCTAFISLKLNSLKCSQGVDSSCDRCKVSPASLALSFWHCPKLSTYWNLIFGTLSDVFKMVIEPDPMIAIFGVAGKNNKNLTEVKFNMTKCVTLLARRLILLHLKSPQPPSGTQWLREVMQHLKLEKLRHTIHGPSDKFDQIWKPFIYELSQVYLLSYVCLLPQSTSQFPVICLYFVQLPVTVLCRMYVLSFCFLSCNEF